MKKKFFLFVLSILSICGLHAQYVVPSEGVFRIVNMEYGVALTEDENSNLYSNHANGDTDYTQLWYLKPSGSNYTIQNLASKKYIQTGNIAHEVAYWTGLFPCEFNIVANPSKGANAYNIWDPTYEDPTLGTIGLHSKGQNDKVVRWNSESDKKASEWRFVSVKVPEEYLKELAEYQEELEKEYEVLQSADKYEAILADIFEDPACTQLKEAYAAMDEGELSTKLGTLNLPEALVAMVLKVRSGDWAEPNDNPEKPGWDSDYAKKFRVQLVEPHSIAGEITSWFQINAHTNMDNPTGLYANDREFMFIFVEGEIKEGSELWVTWLNGHTKMPDYNNGYSNGKRLESGLNIVPFSANGSALYFNYLVHTYNGATKTFPHKLSEFDDLKIHVEGGHINSYYNAYGDALYEADNDSSWVYYEERANLRNITILGKRQILQFELNDVTITEDGKTWTDRGLAKLFPDELPTSLPKNQRINAIVEAWDRIMFSELMTHGLVSKELVDSMNLIYPRWDGEWKTKAEIYNYDGYAEFCEGRDYSEYFNHRGLAFGTTSGYMYGGWDHCGYHINTTPSILTKIATEAGPGWGPAHEIGHQHQSIFTFNGLTEVTNNLFSNIGVWYMGMGTSRVNGTSGNLVNTYHVYRTGGDFFGYETQHIWVQTQMYYRLWLYYHRVGHNTQFYPRLFELLRRNPLDKSGPWGSEIRDGESVSFSNVQGKTTMLQFYQLCCDAAQEDLTEFFRAHGFFKVMDGRFVGDYSNSKYYQTQEEIDAAIAAVKAKGYPINKKALYINDYTPDATYGHDGKTQRSYWDDDPSANWGAGSFPTSGGENAEIGCYVDFLTRDAVTGEYKYTLSDLNLSISGGDGALGFGVYSDKGEIQAFSSHHNFELNDSVAYHLVNGDYKVVAIAADDNDVEIALTGDSITGKYKFTLTDNRIHISGGANALGFIVYNKNGVAQTFSGIPTFYVSEALSSLLISGEAYIMACGIGGEEVAVEFIGGLEETQIALLRGVLSSAKNYLAKYDETGTKVGYFIPDSLTSLQALVLQVEEVLVDTAKHNYGEWYLAVDSAITALLANLDARVPLMTGCYYSVSVSNDPAYSLIYASAGLRASTAGTAEFDNQWMLVPATEANTYYLQNRHSGNYVSAVNDGVRAKATATSTSGALAFRLVPGEPGRFMLQRVDNTNIYICFDSSDRLVKGGKGTSTTSASPWWSITLADDLLGLPEEGTNGKCIIYHIQCVDNGKYLYNYATGRANGRLAAGEYESADDTKYWFYFAQGSAEGQYRIYNYATGKSLVWDGSYFYVNKDTDTPAEYSITAAEDRSGLVISGQEGFWRMSSYLTVNAADKSLFKLIKIGEATNTGIEGIYDDKASAIGTYYDLTGRPVKNPTAGIYIHNGKKVILK